MLHFKKRVLKFQNILRQFLGLFALMNAQIHYLYFFQSCNLTEKRPNIAVLKLRDAFTGIYNVSLSHVVWTGQQSQLAPLLPQETVSHLLYLQWGSISVIFACIISHLHDFPI